MRIVDGLHDGKSAGMFAPSLFRLQAGATSSSRIFRRR
jgi:hypothetical protein